MKKRLIAGDRPTGKLHIGHYVGTLRPRVELQNNYETFVLIADAQALTDNFDNPKKLRDSVSEIMLDYLAVGINPEMVPIGLQSGIIQIPELTSYLANLVSFSRVLLNPTVKDEIKQKDMGNEAPFGFVAYPVSQAADILIVNAEYVSGGDDQVPMIELTRQIARRFNNIYGDVFFTETKYIKGVFGRLPGTDGAAKMGKSLGNVIYLSDSNDSIREKVKKMYTDPSRLRATDPGTVEGNPVFTYLDAFQEQCDTQIIVNELKERYRKGGVGDAEVKKHLTEMLISVIEPIRTKREELQNNMDYVKAVLKQGTATWQNQAEITMKKVRNAVGLYSIN
jgi:tryptophanyl-tRNA synthetase